jgi:serine/threonine-protein kinase ATR
VSRALSLLEPVEIDAFAFRKKLKNDRVSRGSSSEKIREQCDLANQVLLATKWMVESRQKLGKIIVERFKVVVELRPHWEEAYFEFGRYLEYLYHEARSREQASNDAQLQSRQGKPKAAMSSKSLPMDESHQQANVYLLQVIELYAKAALSGTEHITGWLPRMLTLWFSSSMPDALKCKATLDKLQNRMTKTGESVPAYIWYSCISQLVSRAQHPNPETARIVQTLLITKTLVHMPQQGIWHIAGMLHSHSSERQNIGRSIIREAGHICLREKGFSSATKDMFDDCMKLFRNLADLAVYDAKDRRMNWKFGENCNLTRILVPLKTALHICIPESVSSNSGFVHFPSDQMYIKSFSDQVDVASSKARPKIISLLTTCGRKIKFLCKQEKNGDLRKDAHMMEFNAVINRLLQEDPDGRRRRVRLRTFSVICLNEECGILEWVNDTNTLRNLITEAHSYWPEEYPLLQARDVGEELRKAQDDLFGDFEALLGKYEELILNRYRPYLHRWFFEQYTDPTEWLEAKIFFTRSAAVWSAVGHVIGLGDRHTENILLDTTNGELVHVDFDCLFDKGLTLARAEIVPFRLTPNIVDAMGVCGIEGTYRKTMEVCMKLLRSNKDTLLSILEPFLRDPTVAWGRSGRAQQQQKSSAQSMRAPVALTDHDNPDAKEALNKITKRLDGVYNISHPRAVEISNAYAARKSVAPVRGLGATQDESLPLSVQGQVQRLIDEATDEINLMQMYFGWTPWL